MDYFNLKSLKDLPPLSEVKELEPISEQDDFEKELASLRVLDLPDDFEEEKSFESSEQASEDKLSQEAAINLSQKPLDEILSAQPDPFALSLGSRQKVFIPRGFSGIFF